MERLDKQALLMHLSQWDTFLKRKVRLIACGGTAMTLLGVKASTRDIDFMVPDYTEYKYLIRTIEDLGYKNRSGWGWARPDEPFVFDLFPGNRIHTTELLENPLNNDRHRPFKEFAHIYVGILNDHDLIVSKLFRGTGVDMEDCCALAQAHKEDIDLSDLKAHFFEMLSYHPVGEQRVKGHWDSFIKRMKEAK